MVTFQESSKVSLHKDGKRIFIFILLALSIFQNLTVEAVILIWYTCFTNLLSKIFYTVAKKFNAWQVNLYTSAKEGEHLHKIMIVEDDKALLNGIALALKCADMEVVPCHNIKSAQTRLAGVNFDLVILDVNLPDGNGLDLLCEVKRTNITPVIMLTANDMETDIVAGLEMGADDYITKPFSLAVLRARVNTQLRKQATRNANQFEQDNFIFDFDLMEYFKNGKAIELSKTEQKLLKLLTDNKGITLKRSVLVDRIWTDGAEYVDENALSVTLKRLRDKLEDDPAKPQYIKTVYGIGYTWAVK